MRCFSPLGLVILLLYVVACSTFTLPRMTLSEHAAEPLFAKSLTMLRAIGVESPLVSSHQVAPTKEATPSNDVSDAAAEPSDSTPTSAAASAGEEDDLFAAGRRSWGRTVRWLSRQLGGLSKLIPGLLGPGASGSGGSSEDGGAEDPRETAAHAVYLAREAAAAGHAGAVVLLAHLRLFGPRASIPTQLLASPAFEPIVLNRSVLPPHDPRRQCIGVGAAPGTFFDVHWDAADMERMPVPDPLLPSLPPDAPAEGALARDDAVWLRFDTESDAVQGLAFAACLTHLQLSALLLHSMAVCPTTRSDSSLHAAVLARSPLLAWVSDADLVAGYGPDIAARIRADAADFKNSDWRRIAEEAAGGAASWVSASAGDINVAWRGAAPGGPVPFPSADSSAAVTLPPEAFFENHADFPHHIKPSNSRNIQMYNGVEALHEDSPLSAHVNPLAWLPQDSLTDEELDAEAAAAGDALLGTEGSAAAGFGGLGGVGLSGNPSSFLASLPPEELGEVLAAMQEEVVAMVAELGLPAGSISVETLFDEAAALTEGMGLQDAVGVDAEGGFSLGSGEGIPGLNMEDLQFQLRSKLLSMVEGRAGGRSPVAAPPEPEGAPSRVAPATAALRRSLTGAPTYVGGMLANVLRSDVAKPWRGVIRTYEHATLTLAMLQLARVRVAPQAILRFRGMEEEAAAATAATAAAASAAGVGAGGSYPLPPAWPIFPTDQAAIDVIDLLAHRRLEVAQVIMAHRHLHGLGGSSLAARPDEEEPDAACARAVDYLLPVAMRTVADATASAAAPPEGSVAQLWEAHEDAQVLTLAGEEERNVDFIRQQALEEGVPEAQFQWANMILYGHPAAGIRPDPEGAADLLREVADVHGNAEARAQLGLLMLDRGMNATEAVAHLERAAEEGSPQAWAGLGYVYESGAGNVTRNLTKAVEYLEKAAAFGYTNAHANLGALYLMGTPPAPVIDGEEPEPPPPPPPGVDPSTIVAFNATAAKYHLSMAASAGFVPAYYNLALIDYYGWDNPARVSNCTAAALHWKQCGDRGGWNVNSPFTLASAFEEFSFAKTGRVNAAEGAAGARGSEPSAQGVLGEAEPDASAGDEASSEGALGALTAALVSSLPTPLVTGWRSATAWVTTWLPGREGAAAATPVTSTTLHLELQAPDAARSALLQYLMLNLVGVGSAADNAAFLLDAGYGADLVDVAALAAGPYGVVGTPGVGLPDAAAAAAGDTPAVTAGGEEPSAEGAPVEGSDSAAVGAPAASPAPLDTSPAARLKQMSSVMPAVIHDVADRALAARQGAASSLAASFLTLVGSWGGGSNYGLPSLVPGQPRGEGGSPWSAWRPTFPLPIGPRHLSYLLYISGAEMRVHHSMARLGDCYADGWEGVPPCALLPASGSLAEPDARQETFGVAETEETAALVAATSTVAFGKWLPRVAVAGLDRFFPLVPLEPWMLLNRAWAAFFWYNKATDNGSPHAMMTLSRALASGRLGSFHQPALPQAPSAPGNASAGQVGPLRLTQNFSRAWELLDKLTVADPMLSEWPVLLARGATVLEWARSEAERLGAAPAPAGDADGEQAATDASTAFTSLFAGLWDCFVYMPPLPGNASALSSMFSGGVSGLQGMLFDDAGIGAEDEAALMAEQEAAMQAAVEAAQQRVNGPRFPVGPFPLTLDDRRLCSVTMRVLVLGSGALAALGTWLAWAFLCSGARRRQA